ATGGAVPAALKKALVATGADVRDASGADDSWGALVLDARRVATPADLAGLREFFAGNLRNLGSGGRVLVLGRIANGADPRVDATRQALDGIVRSIAKELRKGSTANLLWVEDEASLGSALRFFLSGKSAYVDGQPLLLGAGVAPAPKDWDL